MKYPPVHVYTHSGERGRPVGRPVVAEYIDDVRYVRPSTAVIAYMTNDTRSPGQTPPPPPGVCPGERVPVRRRLQLSDLARGQRRPSGRQTDRTDRPSSAARPGVRSIADGGEKLVSNTVVVVTSSRRREYSRGTVWTRQRPPTKRLWNEMVVTACPGLALNLVRSHEDRKKE